MKAPALKPDATESLTPLIETIVAGFSGHFRRHPKLYRWLILTALALILSPIFSLWWNLEERQQWSEIVKNVVETLAVLAGAFAIVQWVNARSDRSTDVLLSLEKEFKDPEVLAGRELVEDGDYGGNGRSKSLDAMLRFYVLLYGVHRARQVPEQSLSICFRYWLAHYFRRDRPGFRRYVDVHFPTLALWLRRDCKEGLRFFRAHRLFDKDTDQEFIDSCPELPP
jgi:hypothetical protein